LSEDVISLAMLGAIVILAGKRDRFDRSVYLYLVAAQALLVAEELAFTSYASVYGFMNLVGHLLRLGSVYCFYQAIVVVGLTSPANLLFHELTARGESLRRSEQRYRNLVECAPDAIFVNRNDSVDYVNPAALQLFGASMPTEVIGRPILDLFHPDYHGIVAGRIRELRAGTPVPLIDERILRLDGSVRDVEVAAFEDDAGQAIEVILRDVTDRREAERHLVEYAARLASSNEDLERFAYVASHDLQEPLRSIVSFSQLLERRYKGKLGEDADEYIQFIIEGGERMRTLILDLLAFSRVAISTPPPGPVDAEEVVDTALTGLDRAIIDSGAEVTHDPLPVVLADATQLGQVFANLVGNAIKYRRAAGGRDGRVLRPGQRDRDRFRVPRPDLRHLSAPPYPGEVRGDRDRARDREADRGATRGADPGRVGAGKRLDVLFHPAGREGRRGAPIEGKRGPGRM
jgi:PAS domain S-box-containing protein